MHKLLTGLGLCLSLTLAACGPGAITPTPGPPPAIPPAPPPTAGAAAVPTTAPTALPSATLAPATATSAPSVPTPTAGTVITPTVPGGASTGPLTKIAVAMGYVPDVQFAPYYLAVDNGYYAAEGLEVQFKYAEVTDVMKAVGDGTVDFGVTSGDEMIPARAAGIPVVYILAQYYRYPVGATAIAGNGPPLNAPADLKGRNIGIPFDGGSSKVALLALLKAGNLTESDVKLTTIGFTQVTALDQKQVDVAMTYLMNEPVQLQALGHQVETLNASDYVNLVSVGATTSERSIKERPELVQHFVNATLRGMRDTLANPDAAFASSLKQMPELTGDQIPRGRSVLTETLKFMQPPTEHPFGWADPAAWQATTDLLQAVGLLTEPVDPATIFTNQFVEAAKP